MGKGEQGDINQRHLDPFRLGGVRGEVMRTWQEVGERGLEVVISWNLLLVDFHQTQGLCTVAENSPSQISREKASTVPSSGIG